MVNRAHAARPRRWGGRAFTRLVALATIGILFTVVLAQLWRATSRDLSFTDAERKGVAYLRPLNHLIGELTDAQSVAVRGGQPEAGRITAAVNAVNAAEDRSGGALGTRQRWSDLRGRIDGLIARHATGDQAYSAYSDVVTLAVDLGRKVGDVSNLILDPQLDTYYLMDAALLRVPDVLVSSGRAADLASLAERDNGARVAVARYQVAVASDAIGAGLRKAMDSTSSPSLGPNVTGQLDSFRSAVDGFVPPATLLQRFEPADSATLVRTADRVRQQALPLADAALGELDALLRTRHDQLAAERAWAVGAAVAGVVLAIALLWLLLPAPVREETADEEPAAPPPPPEGVDTTLVDPRDLMAVEELLHVGRAVRARKRERVDDAG